MTRTTFGGAKMRRKVNGIKCLLSLEIFFRSWKAGFWIYRLYLINMHDEYNRYFFSSQSSTKVRKSFIIRVITSAPCQQCSVYVIHLKTLRACKQRGSTVTRLELLCRDARHDSFSTLLAARLTLEILGKNKHLLFWQPELVYTSVVVPKKNLQFQPSSHSLLLHMWSE